MLITAFVRILAQRDKDISSPPYTVNTTLYMKCKVKYKNFDHTFTVALLGDYSQNVPKPKCTQVKIYLRGVKIYSSEVKTYPSGVKTYPLCISITSICKQINRNHVFIIFKIFNSALF